MNRIKSFFYLFVVIVIMFSRIDNISALWWEQGQQRTEQAKGSLTFYNKSDSDLIVSQQQENGSWRQIASMLPNSRYGEEYLWPGATVTLRFQLSGDPDILEKEITVDPDFPNTITFWAAPIKEVGHCLIP